MATGRSITELGAFYRMRDDWTLARHSDEALRRAISGAFDVSAGFEAIIDAAQDRLAWDAQR